MIKSSLSKLINKVLIFCGAFAISIFTFNASHAQEKLYPNEFNLRRRKIIGRTF